MNEKIEGKTYRLVACEETSYENPNRESCSKHCAFAGDKYNMCRDNRCILLKNRGKVWKEVGK